MSNSRSQSSRDAARRRHRGEPAPRTLQQRLIGPVAAGVAAVLVLGGLGTVGAAWAQGSFSALFDEAGGCTEPTTLSIVADPSIAPALTTIAADFDAQADNCVTTTITAQGSSDTAALLASDAAGEIDAWVPDSSVWLERMGATAASLGRTAPEVTEGGSIATSPVVFAAPASRAAEIASTAVGWSSVYSGAVAGLFPDPDLSSASLAGLVALAEQSPGTDTRDFSSALIELGKVIPDSTTAAFSDALAAARPTVVITTEREIAFNNDNDPEVPLVAVYPTDGTKALNYPFVSLVDGAAVEADVEVPAQAQAPTASPLSEAEVRATLVAGFADAARSADVVFRKEGFRDFKGGGELDKSGLLAWPTQVTPAADGAAQVALLDQWASLTRRSRMLVTVDVSGSMLEPAGNGLRRIDVYQQAAGASLARYANDVEMGVWVFSTKRVGDQDWEEIVPVASLSDPAQKQALSDATTGLPARIRGDTGLYDTVLAGVTKMKGEYDPTRVNSMVIITDGKNDDDNGIGLDDLIAQLDAINDPLKPVPVILIGFGPDTDLPAMQRIAAATGGEAYSAYEPADLGTVFIDAFTHRTCRPNC